MLLMLSGVSGAYFVWREGKQPGAALHLGTAGDLDRTVCKIDVTQMVGAIAPDEAWADGPRCPTCSDLAAL